MKIVICAEVWVMPLWRICGGKKLSGSVSVQGAKNAVLPILAASLIGGGVSVVEHCPDLSDVDASTDILRYLGCKVMQNGGKILVDSDGMSENRVPHCLMLKMRSSVMFLGAILARCGEVCLSAPGGCELGSRPIDLHLQALRELGAEVEEHGGEVCCRAKKLTGARISLPFPSVGATENVMLAACTADGTTVLRNAAREPEIVDLQTFLNAKGACIHGAGTSEIRITGSKPRRSHTEHIVMPDRIAAATYLCAAASAGGEICLQNVVPAHLGTVLDALREMGCTVLAGGSDIQLRRCRGLRAAGPVITRPYPGFPTDAQALLMAASLRAEGTGVFVENIFDNRFRHIPELRHLGGQIHTEGRVALVSGVQRLTGCPVCARDLRGGAALVIAGMAAEGETLVIDAGHICRGYDDFAGTLSGLGADVRCCEMPAANASSD